MDVSPIKCNAPTVVRVRDSYYNLESVVLRAHGGFGKIKVRNTPLQKKIPDNHVDVDVYYCGINFTDNYVRLGIIRGEKFPLIMGSECAGVVVGVGNGVTDIRVGQRVLCLKMHGGLFRGFLHIPRRNCFVIPDRIRMTDAICLGMDFVVAHLCLFEVGHVKATDRVFMQSIGGGVGTSMIQLARCLVGHSLKIFGTAAEWKHAGLLNLGANRVFAHEGDYVGEIIQDYRGGVDIVINTNGGTDITKCLRMLKPFGRLINIGSNSTATYPWSGNWGVVHPSWDTKHMTPGEIMNSNRKITGVNIGDLMEAFPDKVQAILEETFRLFSCKKIQARVSKVVPFDEVTEGIKHLCKRENTGKVIVYIQQEVLNITGPRTPLIRPSGEHSQEKRVTGSPHEVDGTRVPRSQTPSQLSVPSENACQEEEDSRSPHMGDDSEERADQAVPDCEAGGAGRQRGETCLSEEDLDIEEDMEEEEQEGEEKADKGQAEEKDKLSEVQGEQKEKVDKEEEEKEEEDELGVETEEEEEDELGVETEEEDEKGAEKDDENREDKQRAETEEEDEQGLETGEEDDDDGDYDRYCELN